MLHPLRTIGTDDAETDGGGEDIANRSEEDNLLRHCERYIEDAERHTRHGREMAERRSNCGLDRRHLA